jgi:PAS domain S-box-containing protein
VPTLADWCVVDLVGDDGQLQRVAIAHADPDRAPLADELRRRFRPSPTSAHPVPAALRTRRAVYDNAVSEATLTAAVPDSEHAALLRALGIRAYLCVPLVAREQALGTLLFGSTTPDRYSPADVALAEELASRAALAVDNARLYQQAQTELAERRRAENALRASEAHHRLMIEQAPLSIQVLAPDGRTLRVNRAWEALWGVTLDQLGDYNLLQDEQLIAHGIMPAIRRAFAGEAVVLPPVPYAPDRGPHAGQPLWVEAVAYPVKDDDGRVREVVLMHRDVTARREAEDALRRSHSLVQAVIEGTTDTVLAKDLAGRYTLINSAGAAFMNRTPEEIVGKTDWDLFPPAAAESLAANDRAVLASQETQTYEEPFPRDGQTLTFLTTKGVYRDDAGQVVGLIGIARDITARKEAEERLREESRIVETLYRTGRTLAAQLDLQTLVQAVTDATTELTGAEFGAFFYNLANAAGESYTLYTLAGAPREAFAQFPMPRNTAVFVPTFSGEGVVRLDDVTRDPRYGQNPPYHGMPPGHLPVRSYLAVPVISNTGEVLGGLFFGHSRAGVFTARAERLVTDIAAWAAVAMDNARLYRGAQETERRYRGLFEGVADAILVADGAARYVDANPAATTLLGYSRDELLRLGVADVVVGGAAWSQPEFARFVQDSEWRGDLEVRRKDGTTAPVEAWATTVALATGPAYVSVLRDISARRALERLQREFIIMVTHELRTPLTALQGYAQLLQRRPQAAERAADAIVTQVRHLNRMIGDLLDVSRAAAGQLELRRTTVDLTALARATVEQLQTTSAAHSLWLTAPDRPLLGTWDRDRIAQVLQNLIGNAIKYAPNGGEVRVEVEDLGDAAQVSVSDQGIGIAPDELPHLFDRFYRASSTTTGAQGLGLGLYISHSLVVAHGGRIWVESEVGRGSTFRFTLPYPPPTP